MKSKKELTITCADGFELAATAYFPKETKSAIMLAPATGIKRSFYTKFAQFLTENGFGVICFNNRGIIDSNKSTATSKEPSLITWGQYDLPAVFEELKNQFPNTSYHLIGHSAGGQLVGLMPKPQEIKSIFNVASSSGSLHNMKFMFKLQASFFLNIFIPLSNLFLGKTKSKWVGMGEDLPKKVAQQWQKWCNGSGYVAVDFGKAIQEHQYANIHCPSLWVYATDDNIANQANVQEMQSVFVNSKTESICLDPKQLGFKDIGHMKFFSSKRKKLWQHTLDWLHKNI